MKEDVHMPATIWKRKENPNKEDDRIELIDEDKEEDEW